jgi:diguanylate cyclase (GGDEF)-like protein
VNQAADNDKLMVAQASHELTLLNAKVDASRQVLAGLKRDLIDAESQLGGTRAAQLLEANEHLVLAMLQAQADAGHNARMLEEVSRSAALDTLTELPNRGLMLDHFTRDAAEARRRGTCLALLFLDLDNFKQVNDGLGHAIGDEVLKKTAQSLAASVREGDTVSRHGGDEFLILLNGVSRASDAAQIATHLGTALQQPILVSGHQLFLTASIGISIFPDDGDDLDTLIARADAAMYRAKNHGSGGYAFHGQLPVGGVPVDHASLAATPPVSYQTSTLAERRRRHGELRETNERLLQAVIDAQRLQVAAQQGHRKQTEFLAVLAHELRNPLATIRNASELLGRVSGDEQEHMQAMIERQVVHMARLVDDLLDMSRFATGKLRLDRQTIDMTGILAAAIAGFRVAIQTRQHRLTVSLPPGRLELSGDAVRLAQVVNNLLDNASKYTPNGGDIGLSLVGGADQLVLTVSDNGIGITAAALPHIFDTFVQESHAVGFNGMGLGIGLSVVRELIEAHGGTVVATSAGIGRGSQFVVTLPTKAPDTLAPERLSA